jgi:hypothetical protein
VHPPEHFAHAIHGPIAVEITNNERAVDQMGANAESVHPTCAEYSAGEIHTVAAQKVVVTRARLGEADLTLCKAQRRIELPGIDTDIAECCG